MIRQRSERSGDRRAEKASSYKSGSLRMEAGCGNCQGEWSPTCVNQTRDWNRRKREVGAWLFAPILRESGPVGVGNEQRSLRLWPNLPSNALRVRTILTPSVAHSFPVDVLHSSSSIYLHAKLCRAPILGPISVSVSTSHTLFISLPWPYKVRLDVD